jgi:hypothetical protein
VHFTYAFFSDNLIKSAPFENVTVSLGQITPVNFSCNADGDYVLWIINGYFEHLHNPNIYRNRITFYRDEHTSAGLNISMGINVTAETNNNTEIYCIAALIGEPYQNSTTVTLTIAGKVTIGVSTQIKYFFL